MKKQFSLIAFVLAVVFLIAGFWIYRTYIKAKLDNISVQIKEIDCQNNPQVIELVKHPEQSGIFQLELSIEGNATNNISLQIGPSSNQITSDIRIKKGEIETAYINDWYADSAYVKIESDPNTQGKLTLSYQFIGIDSE